MLADQGDTFSRGGTIAPFDLADMPLSHIQQFGQVFLCLIVLLSELQNALAKKLL